MLGTGKLCALYKRPVPWSPSMTQSCLTSDQSNFWAFLSKMSEFRPKSAKGNLVPLHSKFEVRNMVPRNCVKTKFWKKWITLGMNYGWRPLKCCSVQNWTSFKTGEQFLPNWPKFSWLRKVYQTCIVSKVSEAKISVHLSQKVLNFVRGFQSQLHIAYGKTVENLCTGELSILHVHSDLSMGKVYLSGMISKYGRVACTMQATPPSPVEFHKLQHPDPDWPDSTAICWPGSSHNLVQHSIVVAHHRKWETLNISQKDPP